MPADPPTASLATVQTDRPPTIWIGGAPGAGKSTLARAIARRHDLPLHPIDAWTYDHESRLPDRRSRPPLDEQLAAGPEAAADWFEADGAARLELVMADVRARALGLVPAVVEGPELDPIAAPRSPGQSVWLIPTPELTRRARLLRLRPGSPVADGARVEALVARDQVLAERVLARATARGLTVFRLPDDPDWPAVAESVEDALAAALAGPRVPAGPDLAAVRAYENRVVLRQLRLWRSAGGPPVPAYPFFCECGTSGCTADRDLPPEEYAARSAAGPVTAPSHGASS